MNNSLVPMGDEAREPSDLMIDWLALSDGLNDKWADWLPFLVFGVPYAKIAEIFGVDRSAITHAINGNRDFARRITQGRKMVKRQLHYLWLDQKAVTAWKNVDYFLEVDPFAVDDEGKYVIKEASARAMIYREKAKMTRFVLTQLGLHIQRHEVLHAVPQPMFLGDSGLADIVISRVEQVVRGEGLRDVEAIAAEFREISGPDTEPEEFEMSDEEKETEAPYVVTKGRVT